MCNKHFSQENYLEFIRPYKIGNEIFSFSSGENVPIQKYFLDFNLWKGTPIQDTYNNKPIIDWNNEPVFAELAVLRLFQSHNWNGVWVDSYSHGKYRVGLLNTEPIQIPTKYNKLIQSIRNNVGKNGGCWDVFLWKDEKILFIELKRFKKDKIQNTQNVWLEASLLNGLQPENFALIEWKI